MTWLTALLLVAIVVVIVAVTGIQPSGGRRVANTHLMAVARVVLAVMVLVVAWFMYHAR